METIQSLLASPIFSIGLVLFLAGVLGGRTRGVPPIELEPRSYADEDGLVTLRSSGLPSHSSRHGRAARRIFSVCTWIGFALVMLGIWQVKVGPLPWS